MSHFLKITIPAHKKFIQLSQKYKTKNIFFSAAGGGCNGFTYRTKMFKNSFKYKLQPFFDKPDPLWHKVEEKDYNIYICSEGFEHLVNTTIHWEKDFMEEKFVFDNPNAEYEYACKKSFITNRPGLFTL